MNEKMKDSGIEWIGVIPEEWEVHPLYFYFFERNNKNLLEKEKNLLSLSYGRIIRKDIETWEGLLPENFKNYNTIEKDDIVIRPTDLQNDQRSLRTGIARERGIITSVYITLTKKRALVPSYFHYLLHSYDLCKVFYEMGGGVRQALRYAELSKLPALEPPLTEQRTIASFLDDACAKIDGIIADLEHQVDLLKDYKKSLITETVTKGLDKHVKLKDSGIAWIGKIPVHWEVTRLKYISKFKTGGTPDDKSGINTENDGFPWITAPDITDSLDIRNYSQYITDKSVKLHRYSLFPANSILLVCIASVGKIGMLHEYGYANQQITAIMSNNCILPRYLLFYLNSVATKISADASSNVVPIINTRYLSNISVILPSLEQQQDIASFLDTRCAEIDSIIKGKEKQIEQQKEYKKSLIYEYVTGKKRVKGVE